MSIFPLSLVGTPIPCMDLPHAEVETLCADLKAHNWTTGEITELKKWSGGRVALYYQLALQALQRQSAPVFSLCLRNITQINGRRLTSLVLRLLGRNRNNPMYREALFGVARNTVRFKDYWKFTLILGDAIIGGGPEDVAFLKKFQEVFPHLWQTIDLRTPESLVYWV